MILNEQSGSTVLTPVVGGSKTGPGTGILMRVRGEFGRVDECTANKRRYPRGIMEGAIKGLLENLKERKVVGEADHPTDGRGSMLRISHVVTALEVTKDGIILGEADVLDTDAGRVIHTLAQAGVPVGVSSRGKGSVKRVDEGVDEVQSDYVLDTFDFVIDPAMRTAYPKVVESEDSTTEPAPTISEAITIPELPKAPETLMEMKSYLESLPNEVQATLIEEAKSITGSPLLEGIRNGFHTVEATTTESKTETEIVSTDTATATNANTSESQAEVETVNESVQLTETIKRLEDELTAERERLSVLDEAKRLNTELSEQVNKAKEELESLQSSLEEQKRQQTEQIAVLDEQFRVKTEAQVQEQTKLLDEGIQTKVKEIEEGLKEGITKEIELRLEDERKRLSTEIRNNLEQTYNSDPRYGLARKLIETIAETYAPLVANAESVIIKELQEQVKGYRDLGLRLEYEIARSRRTIDVLKEERRVQDIYVELHNRTSGHPKGDIIRELVGKQLTMEGMERKLERMLNMAEFRKPEDAIEEMVAKRVSEIVETEVRDSCQAIKDVYESKVIELEASVTDLRQKLQEGKSISDERSQLNESVIDLKQKLQKAVDAGLKLVKERDDLKVELSERETLVESTQQRSQRDNELIEAKLDGYRKIMLRSDRTALSESIDRAKTVQEIEGILKARSREIMEDTQAQPVRPKAPVRRAIVESAPVEAPIEVEANDDVSDIDVSFLEKLM